MISFIAIVFMAELIVAGAFVALIIRADKKILALNAQVIKFAPDEVLREFRAALKNVHTAVEALVCIIKRKRRLYLIKSAILTVISVFGKGKYKKAAMILNIVFAAANLHAKFTSCRNMGFNNP
jgi:hypothetical protein